MEEACSSSAATLRTEGEPAVITSASCNELGEVARTRLDELCSVPMPPSGEVPHHLSTDEAKGACAGPLAGSSGGSPEQPAAEREHKRSRVGGDLSGNVPNVEGGAENDDSDEEDEEEDSDDKVERKSGKKSRPDPTPSLCEVCQGNPSKYRCPRCGLRTCSVPCIKSHKKSSGCDGQFPASLPMPIKEMTDETLANDYRFLERATRCRELNRRSLKLPDKDVLQKHCWLQRCSRRKRINLQLLPFSMKRRRLNTTTLDDARHMLVKILWMVELVYVSKYGRFTLFTERVRETDTVDSVVRAPHLFAPEDLERPPDSVEEPQNPTSSGSTSLGPRDTAPLHLRQRRDSFLEGGSYRIFSQALGHQEGGELYHLLDKTQSLLECLRGIGLIVEWPVFYVVQEAAADQFPLISDELREKLALVAINPLKGAEVCTTTRLASTDPRFRAERCANCGGPHPLPRCRKLIQCSICRMPGHTANICYKNPEAAFHLCPRCGHRGHKLEDCPMYQAMWRKTMSTGADPAKKPCNNCGKEGHRWQNCPDPIRCTNCGQPG
eukprot:RCo043865